MAANETHDAHNMEIKMLVPATGLWLAAFEDGVVRQVACWALVTCKQHGKTYVAPMVSYDGDIVDATVLEGYVEVVAEDEDDLEDLMNRMDEDEDEDDSTLDS